MNTPRFLFAAVEDSTFRLLDIASGSEIRRVSSYGANPWAGLQLTEELFAVSGDANTIMIFNMSTWEVIKHLSGHGESSRGMCLLPSSNRFASGGVDELAKVWSWESGDCVATFSDPTGNVLAVDHMPESCPNFLFVPSDDDNVHIYDLESGTRTKVLSCGNDVDGIAHDENLGLLFVSNDSGVVRFFDVRNDFHEIFSASCGSAIRTMCFRPETEQLVTVASDGNVRVFDVRDGSRSQIREFSGHGNNSAYGCCDVLHSECFVTSSWDEHVKCWRNDWGKIWDVDCGDDVRGVTTVYSDFGYGGAGPGALFEAGEEVDEARLETLLAERPMMPWIEELRGELRLNDKVLKCPRSVLAVFPEIQEDGVVTVLSSEGLEIEANILTALILGDHSKMKPKVAPDYYKLFQTAGLKKLSYLVAAYVSTIESTKMLVVLLQKSIIMFGESFSAIEAETDDLEDLLEEQLGEGDEGTAASVSVEIKSGFTLGVLNALQSRKDDISLDGTLLRVCRSKNLFGPIMTHTEKPLYEHSDFGLSEDTCPKGFGDTACTHLSEILRTGRFANVRLRVESGDGVEIPAHLDILFLKSESFANMMEREDVIARFTAENILSVKDMPSSEIALRAVIESVYCGSLLADDFGTLIPLWDHAILNVDEAMQDRVVKRLRERSRELKKSGKFMAAVTNVIENLPDRLMDEAGKLWGSIGQTRLVELKNAAITASVQDRLARMDRNFDTRMERLEGEVASLKELMGQVLSLLRQ